MSCQNTSKLLVSNPNKSISAENNLLKQTPRTLNFYLNVNYLLSQMTSTPDFQPLVPFSLVRSACSISCLFLKINEICNYRNQNSVIVITTLNFHEAEACELKIQNK